MTLQTAAVLKVLLARPLKPRYGLEISKDAQLSSGTIYPILARLEHSGWIESFWENIDQVAEGRRRRRYYRLTQEGAVKARRALETTSRRVSLDWLPTPEPPAHGSQA